MACAACCIGPILAVLSAIAALGVTSTIFIGCAGLFLVAAIIATAFIVVRGRRRNASCSVTDERVPVELTRPAAPTSSAGTAPISGADRELPAVGEGR